MTGGEAGAMSQSGEAPAAIHVKTGYWGMHFMLLFFARLGIVEPRLQVDGGLVERRPWGETFWWLPPGQHVVHCSFPWSLYSEAGPATVVVSLRPGELVPLEYDAPRWHLSSKGKWTVHPSQAAPPPPALPPA